jgi:two-component system, NarL family, sensor histidine kinase DevS
VAIPGQRGARPRGTRATGSPGSSSGERGSGDAGRLTFPDLPRLELDELLVQLVERAEEVIGTQGRLRGLLRAQRLVTGDLALPVVLRRIAQSARELVGARHAALGVIGPTGGLVEFVHEGMPDDALARIGHLPQGKGLLGALIDDPRPIRLAHLGDDPRSSGFPAEHPPMESFLGVPIRLRDEVFGNIYVAESTAGEFSAEDEELLSSLATTAGVAIENARLYESARARGRWLQASAAVTRQLLAPDADDDRSLRVIAERTQDIADSDLVLLLFPRDGDGGRLRIEVSVGADAEHLRGRTLPLDGTLAGGVYRRGEPARVAQLAHGTGLATITSGGVEIGPALAVPMTGSGQVHGVLTVARVAGRPGFTPADVDMVGSFANQAALAIELAAARREQERAAMLDERERIAADLHDHVIQRLFAAGLSLQGFATGLGPGRSADRLQAVIVDLDETIKQIRTSIFQLQQDPRAVPVGVRAQVLDVLAQLTPALGFEPGVRFSGVLEGTVPGPVVHDLLAVLREALTNVARHAAAGTAVVELTATGGRLELRVSDDGRGMGAATRRSGLANLRRRAEAHEGALELIPRSPSGTTLRWTVPLPA